MKPTREEIRTMFQIARYAIETALKKDTQINYPKSSDFLDKKSGVFVTIHKNHQLRGCIGYIESDEPLSKVIANAAYLAAFEDDRFQPLSKEEFQDIDLEISVLTPLKKISNTDEIIVGRHGLLVKKNLRQGLLLPQVAVEYRWGKKNFLEQTCNKAGLNKNAWQENNVEIYIFEATIFHEKDII